MTCSRSLGRSGRSVARSLGRSVARSLDRSVARPLGRSVARSLGRSIARSLDRSIVRWLDHSLDRSIAHSIARSLARSLDRSFARSLARSLVRIISGVRISNYGLSEELIGGSNFELLACIIFISPVCEVPITFQKNYDRTSLLFHGVGRGGPGAQRQKWQGTPGDRKPPTRKSKM